MGKQLITAGFSMVLCTYNRAGLLQPTLTHLAALKIPAGCAVELILVNNASTDNTLSFVKDTWVQLQEPFPLQILNESRPGKGYAVETGYDAAQYSYILTVDDDNWLDAYYLVNAEALLWEHPEVGMLQGKNEAVHETELPNWATDNLQTLFAIGGPTKDFGYFPQNFFYVWGAGMVIRKADWDYLRSLGFAFLTSKMPGKAAGEDHELAIALLLLGRKIYYSDKLKYKHYMPVGRISWANLKKGFYIWANLMYYYLLYIIVMEAHEKRLKIDKLKINKKALTVFLKVATSFTWKQHLAYWVMPQEEYYQLRLYRYYSFAKWFYKLSGHALHDINFLQNWILPLLDKNPNKFSMSYDACFDLNKYNRDKLQ